MLIEKISPYWQTLIERLEGALTMHLSSHQSSLDALKRQIKFSSQEHTLHSEETCDPLGASCYTIERCLENRLIHQYKNRCLFLATGSCFGHCRYCFRKESDAMQLSFAPNVVIEDLCSYIKENKQLKEVLITGGDPLTTSDSNLANLLHSIREVNSTILIRIATRAPIFAPKRITPNLLSILKNMKPLWVIPHINHPVEVSREFASEARDALHWLIDSGITMQSQTVLLRGINDDVETLSTLFNDLVTIGIKPGYLFQGDMAVGTSHFRLGLDDAIALFKKLQCELSGLSEPTFAVDLPNGGGKVNMLNLTSKQYEMLKQLYI